MRCTCQTALATWVRADVRPLTPSEEKECAAQAVRMSRASGRGVVGRTHTHTRTHTDSVGEKTLEQHRAADLRGARGEKAWSIFWGVEWPKRVRDYVNPDFDPDSEIRTTQMNPPALVLRNRDMKEKANRRYVLIQELGDHHVIWGWVRPKEVRDIRLEDPGNRKAPARFIKTGDLHRFPFYSKFPKRHQEVA